MPRLFRISHYPSFLLILIMGLLSAIFAINSVDLVRLASANLTYIQRYGLMAILDGGLLQLAMLTLQGMLSLLCYLGFKVIEHILLRRWFNNINV